MTRAWSDKEYSGVADLCRDPACPMTLAGQGLHDTIDHDDPHFGAAAELEASTPHTAEQGAIVTAACAWAGSMQALADLRAAGASDAELAAGQPSLDDRAAELLAAVEAYLADDCDGP